MSRKPAPPHVLRALLGDERGSSAVEFSMVLFPLIFALLIIFQMAIYYMAQASLDAGVIQEADTLVNSFYTGTAPTTPTASALKNAVLAKSGGLINSSNLNVELVKFSALTSSAVPVGNTVTIGSTNASGFTDSILALRAQASVPNFIPGVSSLAMVRSAAIIRRQNY